MSKTSQPQVVIGHYIEAAVYCKINFQMKKVLTIDDKCDYLVNFLVKGRYAYEKTMILANDDFEIVQICEKLKGNSILHTTISRHADMMEIANGSSWSSEKNGNMTVLVCTDDLLKNLKFNNVQNLIHYSMPETWTTFSFRFSACFGYYLQYMKMKESIEAKERDKRPFTMILLDDQNNKELPHLIEFWETHKLSGISEEITSLLEVCPDSVCPGVPDN